MSESDTWLGPFRPHEDLLMAAGFTKEMADAGHRPASVWLSDKSVIVTGSPEELPEGHACQHNCDQMHCSSVEHVLVRNKRSDV